MKHIFLLTVVLLNTLHGFAQTPYPPIIWAADVNTVTNDSFDNGIEYLDIAADPLSGGVYAVVSCSAPSDFGGQVIITPAPNSESLALVKYDYQGNLEWLKQLGFVGYLSNGAKICTGPAGEVYLSSTFSIPEIDFGNGVTVTRNCTTDCDEIFLAKYAADGHPQWARTVYGGEDSFFVISGVEADQEDHVFLLGNYNGTSVRLSPNTVYDNLPESNFFLVRYDAQSGTAQNAHFVSEESDPAAGLHLAVNHHGQIILGGYLTGPLQFANGLVVGANSILGDSFIAGLNADGEAQWAKTISSSSYMEVLGLDVDEEGQAYLAIDASVNLKLNNSTILSIAAEYAGIVLKVGASEFSVPVFIEYNTDDYTVMDVELDNWGNIYTAGYTSEPVEIGDSTYAIDGCVDGLITATSSEGLPQWVRTIGGTGCEGIPNYYYASCIAFDGVGFMHTTGVFLEGFEEDGISVPGSGGFVAKFNTSIVDTDEPATVGNLQINPNPNAGSFVLNLDDTPNQNTLLQIHDLHGRVVFAQEIQSTQQEINTVLPAGAYIVTLQADKPLARQKLIIQR